MTETLFLHNTSKVIVFCQKCSLAAPVLREELPEALPKHIFFAQAKCTGCGAKQLTVLRIPPIVYH